MQQLFNSAITKRRLKVMIQNNITKSKQGDIVFFFFNIVQMLTCNL